MESKSSIPASHRNRSLDLYVPTMYKLQISSERLVKKLHREIIQGEKLDTELRKLKEQLLQKSLAVRTQQGGKTVEIRDAHKLLVLENSLEVSNIRLNDAIIENENLQKHIDHIRFHKNSSLRQALDYDKNIVSASEKAKELNDLKSKNDNMKKKHYTFLTKIHEEHINNTSVCDSNISELDTELKGLSKNQPFQLKSMLEPPKLVKYDMSKIHMYSRLIERYKGLIKSKDEELNSYTHKMQGLNAAMDKVEGKRVSYKTIVDTYIQSFNTNRNGEQHLCRLEDEISSLETLLLTSLDKVYICKNSAIMNIKQKSTILNARRETISKTSARITEAQSKLTLVRSYISVIQPTLNGISSVLSLKGINPITYKPTDTTLDITERNAVETIPQIFEQVETYLLYRTPDPSSFTFITSTTPIPTQSFTTFSKMNISDILDRSDIEWEEESSPMSLNDMKKKAYDKFSQLTV